MPDAETKICVITGGSSGIGLETARKLAQKGWRLALVGRNAERTKAAADAVAVPGGAPPSVHVADLSTLAEMRRIGLELRDQLPRIDVLINNAGAFFRTRELTVDGLERTFALNHMAYFVLTELLRPNLVAAAPSRIVNVASDAHYEAALDFQNLQGEKRFSGWSAYRTSKLCNILHVRELARRLRGTGVAANALHPGFVASSFGDEAIGFLKSAWRLYKRITGITAASGAETSVYVASSDQVAGISGAYFEKSREATPAAAARDDEAATRLWDVSVRLAGAAID